MKKSRLDIHFLALSFIMFSCSGSGSGEQATEESSAVETEEVASAKIYFVSPADGDTVISPLIIQMGVEGMEVEPAGEVKEGMGHHHLIINGSFIEEGVVIPTDSIHIHYGLAQVSDTVDLAPGNYTLTLQFADGFHQSYGEPLSSTINITVVENN